MIEFAYLCSGSSASLRCWRRINIGYTFINIPAKRENQKVNKIGKEYNQSNVKVYFIHNDED